MGIAYDGGGDKNLLKIAAARVIACEKMPYLATALFAMVPVKVEGLNTLASDAKWRLYWDPVKVQEWPVEQLAGVLLHEVGHCIRGHADRFATLSEPNSRHLIYNVAGDSLINVDLRDERIPLPEGCVYVEQIEGATREMSAEQIYHLLVEKAESQCTCGNKGQQGDSQDQQDSQQGQGDQQGSQGDSQDQQGQSGSQGDQQNQGQGDQQGDNGANSQQQGEGQQQQGDNGSGDQQGQQGGSQGSQQGAGGRDPNCPLHGDHEHGEGGEGDCGDPNCNGRGNGPSVGKGGIPQGWDCGGAADGVARGYEQEGDKVDKGVDEDRADLIRQQVAVEIKNHAKNRGTVPGGLSRWADDLLNPKVDWRREISSLLRRQFAYVAGMKDYSYRRPSRRQAAMRGTGQGIILPSMRQPAPPEVAIVIDTSGSMSDEMLKWALAETKGVIKSVGGSSAHGVRVYSCDAHVGKGQRVRNAGQVELTGGGGTDMRIGIKAAYDENPHLAAVICLSDGYTPWPDEPMKGCTLIVGLTDKDSAGSVPEWARTVFVEQ